MNTRSSSSSASSPSQAAAFGAFLVALRAVVVTITARALPPGSGFSFARLPIELPRHRKEPTGFQRWAKETRARVSSALRLLGHEPDFAIDFDVEPGSGACLDVAILAACLGSIGRIGRDALAETLFLGQLSLHEPGKIVGVRGVLPILRDIDRTYPPPPLHRPLTISDESWKAFVPSVNSLEANWSDLRMIATADRIDAIEDKTREFFEISTVAREYLKKDWSPRYPNGLLPTFSEHLVEILGARTARALVIAAAGGHGIRLVGRHPRTLDAARLLRGLLPPMTENEAVETSAIWSAAGMLDREETRTGGLLTERPFRAPHHTAGGENSLGAGRTHGQTYVGGGEPIYPGEASMAHNGVLFLGEAEQIHPIALDRLAEVLSNGEARIRRKDSTEKIPASPCNLVIAVPPCAYDPRTDPERHAKYCSPEKAAETRDRPLRKLRPHIDISVEIGERPEGEEAPRIDELRAVVERAWGFRAGRRIGWRDIDPQTKDEYIARTIADLDGSEDVLPRHVEEARLFALAEVVS